MKIGYTIERVTLDQIRQCWLLKRKCWPLRLGLYQNRFQYLSNLFKYQYIFI